jgi:hypothetical protein
MKTNYGKEIEMRKMMVLITVIGLAVAGKAYAGTAVSANISGNVTWTKANSPYHLNGQIFVLPNSTLTIEAGTVVASYKAQQGSLAVCRGAQIYVNGTASEPVIMTSANDVATWAGSVVTKDANGDVTAITTMGNPKTGTWRAACNEWGNLTIMGDALISASHKGKDAARTAVVAFDGRTNTKCPDGLNQRDMEGFNAALVGDSKIWYGGGNDEDNSGSISYLSLRYGGKVIGLTNELNGLSLGGIGRGTDISHVEIMNNVDDGIEIWGGTVQLDHVSIWNVGDDSLDIDQGWRGSAGYGLIVQGYSVDAAQGSGIGDNCFEHDGAEASDAQPVTTGTIYNFTTIGQPIKGDHGTAWRDNCRMQYDSCIWMELGEDLVKNDNVDGDGAEGYGYNGTLSWANTWANSYNTWTGLDAANVNRCGYDLNSIYADFICQDMDGNLAQITNSVFYNNLYASAYNESTSRGVHDPRMGNVIAANSPIQNLVRSQATLTNGILLPVLFVNPLPANDAVAKNAGAFNGCNWLAGWTATDAYGMTDTSMNGASADLDCDGIVGLSDLSSFSAQWLK